jgi:hypothetical protein
MRHNRLQALLNADDSSIDADLLSSWPTLMESMDDPLTGEARQ